MNSIYWSLVLLISSKSCVGSDLERPHIIFILADDLGWNDLSYHGSNQIPTPNIDALAYTGVILQQYYSAAICTPSRAALLTGRHPYKIGMQHNVLLSSEARGLPLNITLLPEYLKKLNYKTHIVGKWALGHYKKEYTPLYRGFDSHLGLWSGHHDQFDHTAFEASGDTFNVDFEYDIASSLKGLDMRRNMESAPDLLGQYSTRVFTNESIKIIKEHNSTEPLFLYFAHVAVHSGNPYNQFPAPDTRVSNFSYIKNWKRQRFAAMAAEMDDSVGKVMEALAESKLIDNSIIIFASDNGAPLEDAPDENFGSNWPLKGNKYTVFEGGTRAPAVLWSKHVKNPGRISNELFHVTDWLPTLYSAAGGNLSELEEHDGIDQWRVLTDGIPTERQEIIYNIDAEVAAIRVGKFKYIQGLLYETLLDSYSGASRHDSAFHLYNISQVLNSSTYHAVAPITHLNIEKIVSLRKQSQVHCINDTLSNAERPSTCNMLIKPECLFNLEDDPCETTDVSDKYPEILESLKSALQVANETYFPPSNKEIDPRADPKYWNWTWTNFGDYFNDITYC